MRSVEVPRSLATSRRNVLVSVCLVAATALSACMPARATEPVVSSVTPVRTSVYLASNLTGHFVPLDPLTLADVPDVVPLDLNSATWVLSGDGQTLVTIERPTNGGQTAPPDGATVVVRDTATMAERTRFRPPSDVVMPMLSRDGSRLVIQRQPTSAADPSTWYVLTTADGQLLNSVTGGRSSLWPSWIGPDARRLYRLVLGTQSPVLNTGPWPEVVEAYDLVSGDSLGELELPNVLGGAWDTGSRIQQAPVIRQLQPGTALSPDGEHLAIVHAEADALTLVDTQHLSVQRTIAFTSTSPAAALLDLFDIRPLAALAKVLEGTERFATYSPDGRSLYVWGLWGDTTLDEHGKPQVHGLGLELIDVDSATVVARGLDGMSIDQVRFSPDGETLYVLGYLEPTSCSASTTLSCSLWRVDTATLAVQAQRGLSGFHQLFVI